MERAIWTLILIIIGIISLVFCNKKTDSKTTTVIYGIYIISIILFFLYLTR